METVRRWNGIGIKQPGDVWGGVSFSHAGEMGRRGYGQVLVHQVLQDVDGFYRRRGNKTLTSLSSADRVIEPTCVFITKNIYCIVGSHHNPHLGVNPAGVRPFVCAPQRQKLQVVVAPPVSCLQCELLAILEPLDCGCRTSRHETLQHQRLRPLHGKRLWGGGVLDAHLGRCRRS